MLVPWQASHFVPASECSTAGAFISTMISMGQKKQESFTASHFSGEVLPKQLNLGCPQVTRSTLQNRICGGSTRG